MKKVLVTGAGGFIGLHVVEELLKENIEVEGSYKTGGIPDQSEGNGI